ncbi:F-box only protein 47 [Fasciola hepatica]|uniref:F-box only protein 47 n=1 Tax=Fasciola hepatica TaxID=6192 RepID=A0A4E0RWV3_FASHE|nr:F-box only protein 47 [Fasciola hepatica]
MKYVSLRRYFKFLSFFSLGSDPFSFLMKRVSAISCLAENKRTRILSRSSSNPVHHSCQFSDLFGKTPLELKYRILTYLSVGDLLSLLQVSHAARFLVHLYVRSGLCFHLRDFYNPHIWATVPENTTPSALKGYLFRSLFCNTLSSNIKLLEDLLIVHTCNEKSANNSTEKSKCHTKNTFSVAGFSLGTSSCSLGGLKCPALCLFGHFLRTFTATWSEADKQIVFHNLVFHCFHENFWRRLTAVVCGAPGLDPTSELTIRLFLRRLFLDPLAPAPSSNRSIRSNFAVRIAANPSQSFASVSEAKPTNDSDSNGVLNSPVHGNRFLILNTSSLNTSHSGDSGVRLESSPNTVESLSLPCHSASSFSRTVSSSDTLSSSAPLVTRPPATRTAANAVSPAINSWPVAEPLLRILRSYPLVHQARILFILYGPLHRGQLMWRTMCENTAADSEQLSACFGELGNVLQHMLESDAWNSTEILCILDEITSTPDDWLAENVACLLYTSGLRLASMVVTKKAVSGHIGDLAVTLTSLCLVRVSLCYFC